MTQLLREGRLEQTCRSCGRMEAASYYCTGCLRASGEAEWYRNGDLKARQDIAGEMPAARVKRPRGRPGRASGPLTLELEP